MKILLINNGTSFIDEVRDQLKQHDLVEVVQLSGVIYDDSSVDAIVISGGGKGFPVSRSQDYYQTQLDLIRTTPRPLVGLCLGHELIAAAHHQSLAHIRPVRGWQDITVTPAGKELFKANTLTVRQSHQWVVTTTPENYSVLAVSQAGIEAMYSRSRRMISTQFHAECTDGLLEDLLAFICK